MTENISLQQVAQKVFEAALYLCEILYGKVIVRSLAGGLVIDWDLEEIPHLIVKN